MSDKKKLIDKTLAYLKNNGVKSTVSQAYLKGRLKLRKNLYDKRRRVGEYIRLTKSGWQQSRLPLITAIVCVTDDNRELQSATLLSLNSQFYDGLDISIIDLKKFKSASDTVLCRSLNNAAVAGAGEYVFFINAGDCLADSALLKIATVLGKNDGTDILYSDELIVKTRKNETKAFPMFKPDFAPDYLEFYNYIGNFTMIKKALFECGAGFREGYGRERMAALISAAGDSGRKVLHIPEILFYRNVRDNIFGSFRENDNIKRNPVVNKKKEPLVSIIVPNCDHVQDLSRCISSFEEKSLYRNFEWVIVENNSTDPETFDYYGKLEKKGHAKVVHLNGDFNFSRLINYGAAAAGGEYLLLLNNDTELKSPESLGKLVELARRKNCGAAGAKLLYADNTIQHAGVIVGAEGIAGNAFVGKKYNDLGYMKRLVYRQDLSAVTAACMITPRRLFNEVGGFDTALGVNFNDVDYCLKLRSRGLSVIYEPEAVLYHYESKSRGKDNTPAKSARFHGELRIFEDRYRKMLDAGDPFYNRNLKLDRADFLPL